MPPEASSWALQYGPSVGAVVAILGAFRAGWLATRQEVDAWKGRAERAEKQVDTLLPAVEKLSDAIADRGGRA